MNLAAADAAVLADLKKVRLVAVLAVKKAVADVVDARAAIVDPDSAVLAEIAVPAATEAQALAVRAVEAVLDSAAPADVVPALAVLAAAKVVEAAAASTLC